MRRRTRFLALGVVALLVLAACSPAGSNDTTTTAPTTTSTPQATTTTPAGTPETPVELSLAHSYQVTQPQALCGADVIKEVAEAADVGLTIEIFPASQLGGDAARVQSVISGDIDIDIQGASALAAVYPAIGAADGAFVFDDSDHVYNFFTSDASDPLKDGFHSTTGIRILGAWNTGARQFTANVPIREPADLEGLRMRFPPSPQFLMNAAAMGATAVEVAFEELYLALQQNTVDGQENPLVNILGSNLFEVQDYISMSAHQLSTNLVIIGRVWDDLSPAQQEALTAGVEEAMVREPACVADAEEEILADWRANDTIEIIEDVDRDAFRAMAEPYLRDNFSAEQVEVLDAIRSTAAGD